MLLNYYTTLSFEEELVVTDANCYSIEGSQGGEARIGIMVDAQNFFATCF